MRRRSEFQLIAEVFAPLARGDDTQAASLGLGDDAALVRPPPGSELVVSTDAMVRGVHFEASTDPSDVGRKLLRVNLSDLAAKGAEPIAYLLTTGWPADISDDWINRFAAGLAEDQKTFGLHLIGGDTIAMPADLVLSVTIFGHVPAGSLLRRAGARAGDDIYVSGSIGDARLGLMVAQASLTLGAADAAYLRGRLDRPSPRLKQGRALRDIAHAAIDVSDGLLADLGHICEQSRLGARVLLRDVPLSPPARRALQVVPGEHKSLLAFGDDYEVLFTVSADHAARVRSVAARLGIDLARIGTMEEGDRVRVVDEQGREVAFDHLGYQHF